MPSHKLYAYLKTTNLITMRSANVVFGIVTNKHELILVNVKHTCSYNYNATFFCQIHILSYDDNELDIWSDLSHHNIVCFFGAIRHGERIYLFAEFIDGESFTWLCAKVIEA